MTKYGYARVSTARQDLESQIGQIEAYGVDRSFIEGEIISSRKAKRPEFEKMFAELAEGDELHVVKLDRIGRDMIEIAEICTKLDERGVKIGIAGSIIDRSTFEGRALFLVFSMVAEIERELIAERTRAKFARKRANGERIGRKPALSKRQKIEAAKGWETGLSISQISKIYGVARATVSKAISEVRDEDRIEADPELRRTIRLQEKEEREAVRKLEAAKRAADKEKDEAAKEAADV